MKRQMNITGGDLAIACYFVSYYSTENDQASKIAETLLDSEKVSDNAKDALEEFMLYWSKNQCEDDEFLRKCKDQETFIQLAQQA